MFCVEYSLRWYHMSLLAIPSLRILPIFFWLWKRVVPVSASGPNDVAIFGADHTKKDVLELGAPFTDPIADGPTIQTANTVRTRIGNINGREIDLV